MERRPGDAQRRCIAPGLSSLIRDLWLVERLLMLARFGELLKPRQGESKSQTLEALCELVSSRRALVRDRTAIKNRLHNLQTPLLKRQAKQRLHQIENQMEAIDTECRALSEADEALARRLDILLSIPGLGEVTAFTLLAEMPELGSMNKRQTAALADLRPLHANQARGKARASFAVAGQICGTRFICRPLSPSASMRNLKGNIKP